MRHRRCPVPRSGLSPDPGQDVRDAGLPVGRAPSAAGPALSKARALLGEQLMRRLLSSTPPATTSRRAWARTGGPGNRWLDGTTIELFTTTRWRTFGVPGRQASQVRLASHVRTGPGAGTPPRSAATTTARTPWPTSWNPRSPPGSSTSPTAVLLHGPVAPVLRPRRPPGLAGRGRRASVPFQSSGPERRVGAGLLREAATCWPGAAARTGTGPCPG